MHNFYCYDYHRVVSEVFREHRGNNFILYARGAAPGTQRWLGQFAGDHPSTFEGLRHVLTGALNLCACGYSTWGSDIGGYFGFPQPAVYMRWVQFGCFSPLMRPHGVAPREPWHFGEAATRNYKVLAWTRENLLDYIHNAAVLAQQAGLPIMRSMPVAFPSQPQLAALSDQYMFGPDLLIAPVVEEGVARNVTFPPGGWTNIWDGNTFAGPVVRNIVAPLDTIPVYMRPGAAFPVRLARGLRFGESMTAGCVHAVIVTLPSSGEEVSFANANGDAASVSSQPGTGACRWMLRRLPETGALILYGCRPAHAVTLNGKVLPRSKPNEANQEWGNWNQDVPGNRIVVRLPVRQVAGSDPVLTIEVTFAPA
jgi:alpha-glucosidase (family GH31 glycosyl hydrolase)